MTDADLPVAMRDFAEKLSRVFYDNDRSKEALAAVQDGSDLVSRCALDPVPPHALDSHTDVTVRALILSDILFSLSREYESTLRSLRLPGESCESVLRSVSESCEDPVRDILGVPDAYRDIPVSVLLRSYEKKLEEKAELSESSVFFDDPEYVQVIRDSYAGFGDVSSYSADRFATIFTWREGPPIEKESGIDALEEMLNDSLWYDN